MKLLLDANLSSRLAEPLRAAGYEVTHVSDGESLTAEDDAIFELAADHDHVVVTRCLYSTYAHLWPDADEDTRGAVEAALSKERPAQAG